jgi:hypothetical protein
MTATTMQHRSAARRTTVATYDDWIHAGYTIVAEHDLTSLTINDLRPRLEHRSTRPTLRFAYPSQPYSARFPEGHPMTETQL